ncbi:MAG: hypothetical protein WAT39_11210 [Planctomycetota bacterium]
MERHPACRVHLLGNTLPCLLVGVTGVAQGVHQQEPIRYATAIDDNAITRLDARLAAGQLELPPQGASGRLLPLLQELGVPVSSQTLVFSKTSLQRHRIGPRHPRALYFGPDVYVGWAPGAAAIEVTVGDPRLGFVFYKLPQDVALPARFERDDSCLSCHASSRTDDEPGLLVRSVFPDAQGDPVASAGETQVVTSTPLAERWGGWLVTGTFTGAHRGNGVAARDDQGRWRVQGRQAADLRAFAGEFAVDDYPAPTSDIGALLALEQQATIHNLLVRAALRTRVAVARDEQMNDLLHETGMRPPTTRLLDALAREIASALLLAGEPEWSEHHIVPLAAFAASFLVPWPRDPAGVALGQLELRQHTFALPLSPMVHAPAFAALPPPLRERVLARLRVVFDRGRLPGGVRMTIAQRTTVHDHLTATLSGYASR